MCVCVCVCRDISCAQKVLSLSLCLPKQMKNE